MKTPISLWSAAVDLIERKPALGYIGAAVPTSTGFWALVEQATKIGALVSVGVGIAVGVVTWRVQRKQLAKLEAELTGREAGK